MHVLGMSKRKTEVSMLFCGGKNLVEIKPVPAPDLIHLCKQRQDNNLALESGLHEGSGICLFCSLSVLSTWHTVGAQEMFVE